MSDERPRDPDEEPFGGDHEADPPGHDEAPGEEERPEPEPQPDPGLGDDPDPGLDTEETSGLGLTEEFARIEAEIESDATLEGELRPSAGDDHDDAGPEAEEAYDEPVPGDEEEYGADDLGAAGEDDPEPELGQAAAGDRPDQPVEEDETADPDPEPEGAAAGAEAPTVVRQSAVGRAPVRPAPRAPMPVGPLLSEEELAPKTPKLWLRFMAGSVMIVASMAAAVAITGLLFLSDVAAQLQPIPGISEQLEEVDPGAPQTILIIGSDRRAGDEPDLGARSDTTMLLRVDPDKEVLSLFSLPRDLRVDIPGVGPAKLNEAYSVGGEKKTLKTVKRFTGLQVNHVVEINFAGFADAVNAIDCVYIDIDRNYFNDNAGIVAGTEDGYAEIDISSGYRRLCGLKALQYVRYRHTDTDLVRAARQQDFLREARQKVEPKELLGAVIGVGTGNELINIFTDYTRSDISSEDDVIGILKSFAAMRDVPVNEVHFVGDIGGPDDPFVTSSDKQVEKAIDEFLNGVGTEGQRGGKEASEKQDGGEKQKRKKKDRKDIIEDAAVTPTEALADSKFPTLAERFAADAAKNSRRLRMPVFHPTVVVPGSAFSTDSRTYEFENEEDRKESAFKTVIALTQPSTLLEYYGVMGTTWGDPPILRNPSEVRRVKGRDYLLFYDGGRLRLVGWREKGNSYWLNNTLTQSIGEAEMLAMATTMREL